MTSNSKTILCSITLMSAAFMGCPTVPPGPELAAQQFETCVPCHGENGEGSTLVNAPAIAGQAEWYLITQLTNYQEGIRGAHAQDVEGLKMRAMSMSLQTPEDVAAIAKLVSEMPLPKPEQTIKGEHSIGNAHYRTCAACHGVDGKGNKALKAPALRGLNDWYIVNQLRKYKSGVRGKNPRDIAGMMMAPMAATLADDKAIHDVAAHIMTFNE